MNRVTFGKIKQIGKPERLVPIIYPEGSSSTILKVEKQLRFDNSNDKVIMKYDGIDYETGIPSSLVENVETFYPIKYAFSLDESYYNELLKQLV